MLQGFIDAMGPPLVEGDLVPRPWSKFRFGVEHSPLAPPLPRGYNEGGGGVAGVPDTTYLEDGACFEPNLTNAERQWLADHELYHPGRVVILRRIQLWDAEVALRLKSLFAKKVVDTFEHSCSQILPFGESKKDLTSLFETKRSSRRRRKK